MHLRLLISLQTLLLLVACADAASAPTDDSAHELSLLPNNDHSYVPVFANLALDCIHKEYSNKIAHFMSSDEDLKPPRELYPAFYGCFDWHSSVHGHWLLVRLLNTHPNLIDRPTAVSYTHLTLPTISWV